MKNRIIVLGLALCLFFTTGCAALLERSYYSSTAHVDRPTVAEDPSVLRVENYRELVSAVLYLVSQGAEEGMIQLHDYTGTVESDLTAACAEVATEDPLGAYCVDYIKHEYIRVVSDYQATLDIRYRRTQEQVRSMVNVTGTGAIRTELQEALERFADQVVLRVAYFAQDEASMEALVHQAYYDTPAAALGRPEVEISLYPDSGRERVVEILLTYPESVEELRRKREAVTEAVGQVTLPAPAQAAAMQASAAVEAAEGLRKVAAYGPKGGNTTYAALVEGRGNAEGMALAYALLCREIQLPCEILEGTRNGEPWFWNRVTLSNGEALYLDPSQERAVASDAQDFFAAGYRWEEGPEEEISGQSLEKEENEVENQ